MVRSRKGYSISGRPLSGRGEAVSRLLGLLALLENLIGRTTLGRGAGLALELAVPVGLGAALSTVHRRRESMLRAQTTEERVQASETLLDEERARNAPLLQVLRNYGAAEKSQSALRTS